VRELFASPDAGQLGLYGSLGYDLTFQFEPIELKKGRSEEQRDLVMYLPDEIVVVDQQKKAAWKIKYDFTQTKTAATTKGLPRVAAESKYVPAGPNDTFEPRDSAKGKYAEAVVRAKEEFRVGNLFEVVLSQAFREKLNAKPSAVFRRCVRVYCVDFCFYSCNHQCSRTAALLFVQ
jgi:anthranilate synthase